MDRKHVCIIAEAGVNHNGDIEKALELVRVAADSGADYVKFQTFYADKLVTRDARKAAYQQVNMGEKSGSTQYEMLKALELSREQHNTLIEEAKRCDIKFLSTAFDLDSLEYLKSLALGLYKIPSGEITNYPYLKKIASYGKPVILSTGMATREEIGAALDVLLGGGIAKDDVTVLHCNTEYPTPMCDVNLLAMHDIRDSFGIKVGYSDHTLGIEVAIAAVALGATVIEKHFTLDKTLPGPDHAASLEPCELRAMVSAIRNIEGAISGDGLKMPTESEIPNIVVARKSLFYSRRLEAGHCLSGEDLVALRPGDGVSPMYYPAILGKILRYAVDQHQQVALEDIS